MSSEFALIAALEPLLTGDAPGVPLGVGDDAAVVEVAGTPVALSVDAMVDNVHFDLQISTFGDVGWKALAVNVSDLAAIGAWASASVVALQLPDSVDVDDVVSLYRGMQEAADRWQVRVVGGDVVSGPALALTVTVVGPLQGGRPLRRSGARPGDAVVVIGRLGEAAAGLALHRAGAVELLERYPQLLLRHRRPEALPEAGGVLAELAAHACIDVSDGLGQDLGHVARRSEVGVLLHAARLPVTAAVAAAAEWLGQDPLELVCGGGDDLALAATLPPAEVTVLAERLDRLGIPWSRPGEVTDGRGVVLVTEDGSHRDISGLGHEHRQVG